MTPDGSLFPDAEAREYPSQQIVRRELAGDFRQALLSETQFLGHQLAGALLRELSGGLMDVGMRTLECIEVSAARGDDSGVGTVEANAFFQVFA